jgi:hypothetical protein
VSRSIIFSPIDKGSFDELFLVAKKYDELDFKVQFIITNDNHYVHEQKNLINSLDFDYIDVSELFSLSPLSFAWANGRFGIFLDLLRNIIRSFKIKAKVKSIITPNIAAIYFGSDRHQGWCTALVKQGNKQNIPTATIQYAIFSEEGELKRKYLLQDKFGFQYRVSSTLNKLLSIFVKSNVRYYKGEPVLMWTGPKVLANYLCGLFPRDPWSQLGGYSKFYCVESANVKKSFKNKPEIHKRIFVTGKPSSDDLSFSVNDFDKGEIANDRLIILVALPQMAEHRMMPWDEHLSKTEFLFKTISLVKKSKIWVTLHPKSDIGNYQKLFYKYNVEIMNGNIYNLIYNCNIFVSAYSSTLTTAYALRKRCVVLNYLYSWIDEYEFLDKSDTAFIVKDANLLPMMLNSAISSYYSSDIESDYDETWSVINGTATNNIVSLVCT